MEQEGEVDTVYFIHDSKRKWVTLKQLKGLTLPAMNKESGIKEFAETIIAWKKQNQVMYPEDILNFMVECNLISAFDLKGLILEHDKKKVDVKLPESYITKV